MVHIRGESNIMQLTQKESMLLNDEKSMEEICVIKYQNYSAQANDPELKQLFNKLSTEEQHHYDMLNQMIQGQQPNMNQQQQQQNQAQQSQPQKNQSQKSTSGSVMANTGDKVLCTDLLATEKYISGTYDTAVFESANSSVRQALQHIQKEEQQHGEQIFNYMNNHGMYNVQ